uniref:Uncharacterized protein n=1 Tax=Solanum tuberosum TaxID=4113 RepID=M1A7K9_SOLTU
MLLMSQHCKFLVFAGIKLLELRVYGELPLYLRGRSKVWSAYALAFPDPALGDYTGYVVVVMVVELLVPTLNCKLVDGLLFVRV